MNMAHHIRHSANKPRRRRHPGFIVPSLLLLLIVLTLQIAVRFSDIEAISELHAALKHQQKVLSVTDDYQDIVMSIDPLSANNAGDIAPGIEWRVSLRGGVYNLNHALQWIDTRETAKINLGQIGALQRVLRACGHDPGLAITLVDQASRLPKPTNGPVPILALEADEKLPRKLLLNLQQCIDMRPYMARFELLNAQPSIGAAALGISINHYREIVEQIEDGLINSRSVLKQELSKHGYDANLAMNSLSLSLTPNWWTVELLDNGLVFARFTVTEMPNLTRQIVDSGFHWTPSGP